MRKVNINKQLPLTIRKANVTKINKKLLESKNNFISIKNIGSKFIIAENFHKPISKIFLFDE